MAKQAKTFFAVGRASDDDRDPQPADDEDDPEVRAVLRRQQIEDAEMLAHAESAASAATARAPQFPAFPARPSPLTPGWDEAIAATGFPDPPALGPADLFKPRGPESAWVRQLVVPTRLNVDVPLCNMPYEGTSTTYSWQPSPAIGRQDLADMKNLADG